MLTTRNPRRRGDDEDITIPGAAVTRLRLAGRGGHRLTIRLCLTSCSSVLHTYHLHQWIKIHAIVVPTIVVPPKVHH